MMHSASAPGKVILLGEHAVVYGYPAIAIPFGTMRATAEAVPSPSGSGVSIIARDVGRALRVHLDDDTPDNALTYAAQLALRALGKPSLDLTIEIKSSIPIGGGFGSGAAVSAALMRVIALAVERPFVNEELNQLVFEVEKMHHGTPSGIDNTVIVLNQPIFFQKDKLIQPFKVESPLTFVIAYSGVPASTRETVGDVRKLYQSNPDHYGSILAQIGALVTTGQNALQTGEVHQLGELMTQNHRLLRELTISSEILDRLVETAQSAGAFGAKLSGGGRGGNIIALAPPEKSEGISAALRTAGAVRTWSLILGEAPTDPKT